MALCGSGRLYRETGGPQAAPPGDSLQRTKPRRTLDIERCHLRVCEAEEFEGRVLLRTVGRVPRSLWFVLLLPQQPATHVANTR